MTYVLFFFLLIIVLLAYKRFGLANITIIGVVPLIVELLVANAYQKEWSFYPNLDTVIIVTLGLLGFLLGEILSSKKIKVKSLGNPNFTVVKKNKLIVLFFIQLFSYVLFARSLMSAMGGNLLVAIAKYNIQTKVEGVSVPFPVGVGPLYFLSLKISIICSALLALYYVKKVKTSKFWLWINFIIGLLASMMMGGRIMLLTSLVSFAFSYTFFLKAFLVNSATKLKGVILKFGLVFIVFGISFSLLGGILGHEESESKDSEQESIAYNFAVYCGAPLKNFDTFVKSHYSSNCSLPGEYTFSYLWSNLLKKGRDRSKLLEFEYENGYVLGNVKTAFLYPYYDGGFVFVFFSFLFSGILSGYILRKSVKKMKFLNAGFVDFWSILLFALVGRVAFFFFDDCLWPWFFKLFDFHDFTYIILILVYLYGFKNFKKII